MATIHDILSRIRERRKAGDDVSSLAIDEVDTPELSRQLADITGKSVLDIESELRSGTARMFGVQITVSAGKTLIANRAP